MGYFYDLTSSYFKSTEDGQYHFFPWGVFGPGYVVPSVQEVERFRKFIGKYLIGGISIFLVIFWQTDGVVAPLIFGVIYIIAFLLWVRHQCRDLERSGEKLTYRENVITQARTYRVAFLWFMISGCLFLFLSSFIVLLGSSTKWPFAVGVMVVSVLIAIYYWILLSIKRRDNRSGS